MINIPKLTISHDSYNQIGSSAISYQTKLINQANEIKVLVKSMQEVWNGKSANVAIDALKNSADSFKKMSELIHPYITEYKKLTAQFAVIYGEFQ